MNTGNSKEIVQKAVYNAIDTVNRQLPAGSRLEKSINEVIIGRSSKLDSLALINFFVACEQNVAGEVGRNIVLMERVAADNPQELFSTVGTLIDFLISELDI